MLRVAVDSAPSPDAKAESLARLGVCLAQLGRIDEARSILLELRQKYSRGQFPRVSIRLMILEGVISYYENLIDSTDRLRRAHALAKVGGISDLRAESSVWMAHLAFNFESYSIFGQGICDALEGFSLLDDSHRARACLLVADALQYLADRSAARDWYNLARILSRRAHDHGVLTAIEYNRLAIGLSRIRVDRALGNATPTSWHRDWLGELGSVERLHLGFDARALSDLMDLCGAYTYEICGDFVSAHALLTKIRDSGSAERCGVSDALLGIEIGWCQFKAADISSRDSILNVDVNKIEALSQNERLIALMLIKDVMGDNISLSDTNCCARMAGDAIGHFERTVSEMSRAIEGARDSYLTIRSLVLCDNSTMGWKS